MDSFYRLHLLEGNSVDFISRLDCRTSALLMRINNYHFLCDYCFYFILWFDVISTPVIEYRTKERDSFAVDHVREIRIKRHFSC